MKRADFHSQFNTQAVTQQTDYRKSWRGSGEGPIPQLLNPVLQATLPPPPPPSLVHLGEESDFGQHRDKAGSGGRAFQNKRVTSAK